jgi:hypothetical protein
MLLFKWKIACLLLETKKYWGEQEFKEVLKLKTTQKSETDIFLAVECYFSLAELAYTKERYDKSMKLLMKSLLVGKYCVTFELDRKKEKYKDWLISIFKIGNL